MTSDWRQPPPETEAENEARDSAPEEIFPLAEFEEAAAAPPVAEQYVESTLDDARRTYVKIHYERFAGLFDRCDAVGGMRLSFGLAPFLFGGLWFLYRKMYLEGFLLLAASLSLSAYVNIFYLTGPEAPPFLATLIQFSLAVLVGLCGKAFYWKATDRRIEKAMRLYPRGPQNALAWLDDTGGVNVPIVVLMGLFTVVFYGAVAAAGALLRNPALLIHLI